MSCYISIDLGGTIVKTGLVRDGKVVASSRIEASSGKGLGPMLEPLARAVDKLVADLHGDSLEGVAMAFPGIVDFDAGRNIRGRPFLYWRFAKKLCQKAKILPSTPLHICIFPKD